MEPNPEKRCRRHGSAALCCKRAHTEKLLTIIMFQSLEMAAAPVNACRLSTRQSINIHWIYQQKVDIAECVLKTAKY